MSRNATTASSSYSMSAGLSLPRMRQKTQSVTAPPRRPVIIPACRAETTREGAPDGNVSEVQAQDPEERQPREARVHVVPQGVSRSFRLAAPGLATAPVREDASNPNRRPPGPADPGTGPGCTPPRAACASAG